MEKLYPLKFVPQFFHRIWGGHRLYPLFGMKPSKQSIGEAWLVSNMEGHSSRVSQGPLKDWSLQELIDTYGSELLGSQVSENENVTFPLLIKLIDAAENLSIQVHPNDELALQRHHSLGKTEFWFIMGNEAGAYILNGFNETLNPKALEKLVEEGSLMDKMNKVYSLPGKMFYIPSGRPHAIGGGNLIAEIQQSSDITYRLYDYDRIDRQTNQKRELHLKEAFDALDFSLYPCKPDYYSMNKNEINKTITNPYFKIDFYPISGFMSRDYSSIDCFVILMCVGGKLNFIHEESHFPLSIGEVLFLPANTTKIQVESSNGRFLEISIGC